MALTQESLLSFLLEHGGKVRNSDLLNHFRSLISCCDPAEKQHNRDLFKKLINSVAVVKLIDDVKFVVVKKRYQDFAHSSQKKQMDESFSSRFSYTSPIKTGSDIENSSSSSPSAQKQSGSGQKKRPLSSGDLTTVKILNISADQTHKSRKSGAVFAVVAVKSPPSAPAPQDALLPLHERADKTTTKVASTSKKDSTKESNCSTRQKDMGPQYSSLRSLNKNNKHPDDAKYSESVPLEPLAHQWLVKCAAGQWGQIYTLMLQDIYLVLRKDFMSGFTALHWAAKDGNHDMIKKLIDISRKKGVNVNVNCKSHGGYTPLHIAAMHGQTEVMVVLVRRYRANTNERDNDGKKAVRYLEKGVSQEIKELLGGMHGKERMGEEEFKEQAKGFNTISKLFQPHMGKKHKTAMKFAHEW